MAIRIPFAGKYVYFGPETGLHTQGEARAETYDLTGPRYYDGHDLSALTWYVRATHPDYHTIINKQLSVTIAPDDEEAVVISWPVDADFMACSGELQVQFVAKSAAGTEIIKLQSNGLQISPSVEGTAAPPKNMFEAALAQMQDLADTAANAAAQSKQDAERADDAVATTAENVAVAEKAVETAKESVKEAAGLVEQTEAKAAAAEASAKLAESWAVGGTGSREGEDTDNAKYYAQIAQQVAQGGVGYYETPEALRTAHPTGQAGNWAIVGSTDTIWVWDTDTNDWVDSHGNIDMSNYYTKTEADARFSAMSSGVPTVSATKEQNYFDIDLPSTNQFVIVPNAAYATGDTFRIAGRAVEAMLPNGDSLPDAFFAANAKVMCLWADTILYFVGGGTVPNNVMRYRMDDGTPGQQPEQTIWGQTSDGQDAYVHSCTKAVYNPETGKTLDEDFETMAIHTYTCVTSGTNHALTGTGNNIKFVADSDFAEGDTISVNGTTVTAQTQGGETLGDGAWVAGAVVMCYLEGSTLNFNEGAFGAVKSGQIIFASALNSMNVNTYTNYDSPYFSNGVCQKSCRLHFFAAIGFQAQNAAAFTFSVTVNGVVKLSTKGSDGGADNINRDMGTLEINKGDVVSASFPMGAGRANQRGGAIIGVLN